MHIVRWIHWALPNEVGSTYASSLMLSEASADTQPSLMLRQALWDASGLHLLVSIHRKDISFRERDREAPAVCSASAVSQQRSAAQCPLSPAQTGALLLRLCRLAASHMHFVDSTRRTHHSRGLFFWHCSLCCASSGMCRISLLHSTAVAQDLQSMNVKAACSELYVLRIAVQCLGSVRLARAALLAGVWPGVYRSDM